MNKNSTPVLKAIDEGNLEFIQEALRCEPETLVFPNKIIKILSGGYRDNPDILYYPNKLSGIPFPEEDSTYPLRHAIAEKNIDIIKTIMSAFSDSKVIKKCFEESQFSDSLKYSIGLFNYYKQACEPYGKNLVLSILDAIEEDPTRPFLHELIFAIKETKFPYVDESLHIARYGNMFAVAAGKSEEANEFKNHKVIFEPLLSLFDDDHPSLNRKKNTVYFECPDVFVRPFIGVLPWEVKPEMGDEWGRGLYSNSKLNDIPPLTVSNHYKQPGLDKFLALFDDSVKKKQRLNYLFLELCKQSIPKKHRPEILELLQKGYAPYPNDLNHTFFVSRKDPEIVQLLLSNGLKPDVEDRHGRTFMEVYGADAPFEVCKLFIDAGANLYHSSYSDYKYQDTPIYSLIKAGRVDVVQYFLENYPSDVSFQYVGEDGKKYGGLLHIALKNSDGSKDQMVELLLSHGAEPDAINEIEC